MKRVYALDYRGRAGRRQHLVWEDPPAGVAGVRVKNVTNEAQGARIVVDYSIHGRPFRRVVRVRSTHVFDVKVVEAWR